MSFNEFDPSPDDKRLMGEALWAALEPRLPPASTCSVADCGRVLGNGSARGYCNKHYQRWRTHGSTDAQRSFNDPLADRLRSKIRINDDTGCWEWTGYLNADGYGHLRVGARMVGAHRLSYTEHVDDIPEGFQIDHLCKVRHCINPDHLEAVTLRENVLRSENPAAKQARRTRCKNGHEFTPDNTRTSKRKRYCIECAAIRAATNHVGEDV